VWIALRRFKNCRICKRDLLAQNVVRKFDRGVALKRFQAIARPCLL
jgi:hypothetical protein